jgi:hypothetical protein
MFTRLKNLIVGLVFLLCVISIERQLNKEDDMDRETTKVWKWWFIAVLLIAVVRLLSGCAPAQPHIISMTVPYTSTLLLDSADDAWGRTKCEVGGEPIIYIHPRVGNRLPWVMLHERVHVEQARHFPGGCFSFARRYQEDHEFQLQAEVQAFCVVYDQQARMGIIPNPSAPDIVEALASPSYGSHWSKITIANHLSCGGNSNGQERQWQFSPPDGTGAVSQRPP